MPSPGIGRRTTQVETRVSTVSTWSAAGPGSGLAQRALKCRSGNPVSSPVAGVPPRSATPVDQRSRERTRAGDGPWTGKNPSKDSAGPLRLPRRRDRFSPVLGIVTCRRQAILHVRHASYLASRKPENIHR